jgi:hypothetical protein
MKSKMPFLGAIGLAAIGVAACHHNDNGSPASTTMTPPPTGTSTTMALDTPLTLGLAEQTSESSAPFAVNNNAVTFTDTSETTSPVAINQP